MDPDALKAAAPHSWEDAAIVGFIVRALKAKPQIGLKACLRLARDAPHDIDPMLYGRPLESCSRRAFKPLWLEAKRQLAEAAERLLQAQVAADLRAQEQRRLVARRRIEEQRRLSAELRAAQQAAQQRLNAPANEMAAGLTGLAALAHGSWEPNGWICDERTIKVPATAWTHCSAGYYSRRAVARRNIFRTNSFAVLQLHLDVHAHTLCRIELGNARLGLLGVAALRRGLTASGRRLPLQLLNLYVAVADCIAHSTRGKLCVSCRDARRANDCQRRAA